MTSFAFTKGGSGLINLDAPLKRDEPPMLWVRVLAPFGRGSDGIAVPGETIEMPAFYARNVVGRGKAEFLTDPRKVRKAARATMARAEAIEAARAAAMPKPVPPPMTPPALPADELERCWVRSLRSHVGMDGRLAEPGTCYQMPLRDACSRVKSYAARGKVQQIEILDGPPSEKGK